VPRSMFGRGTHVRFTDSVHVLRKWTTKENENSQLAMDLSTLSSQEKDAARQPGRDPGVPQVRGGGRGPILHPGT